MELARPVLQLRLGICFLHKSEFVTSTHSTRRSIEVCEMRDTERDRDRQTDRERERESKRAYTQRKASKLNTCTRETRLDHRSRLLSSASPPLAPEPDTDRSSSPEALRFPTTFRRYQAAPKGAASPGARSAGAVLVSGAREGTARGVWVRVGVCLLNRENTRRRRG